MSQNAGYKVKVIRPLPVHPVIVICLPGDGYVGKFCGESLITSTSAEIAVMFNPYNFPPHVTIDKGTLILHGYQFYVGSTNCQNLVIVTTDLRITESDTATKVCRQLARYVKELAPREVLILDAIIPAKKYRGNNVTQMRVDAPSDEFWDGKSMVPFQVKTDKDKYFLYLAVAFKREQISARGIICETSGKDIDPEGAKKLLNVLIGHPAFPVQFDYQRMEAIAAEIHKDLEKLTEKEREKNNKENSQKKQQNRDLHYIQ